MVAVNERTPPPSNGSSPGRKPKSSVDDIIRIAWALFEKNGFDDTTMADVATAVGLSRRTLFNYFPSKEALLYPLADEYMAAFTQQLLARPDDEPLFASLEYCLAASQPLKIDMESRFNPGPVVLAARLDDAAVRFSRDYWAREMERAVARRLSGVEGGDVLAGFVGAIAAQVWTETTKRMRAIGSEANLDEALADVMSSFKRLF